MNKKKECEPASFSEYKQSDKRDLSADTKIIVALIREQPLNRTMLCEKAGIDTSTFYRVRRVLLNRNIIKKNDKGYCLFNFRDQQSLWEMVQQRCLEAGGPLIELKVGKRWINHDRFSPRSIGLDGEYHREVIKGIMIPRGANNLKEAASVSIPDDYFGFVLTKSLLNEGDLLFWRKRKFEVKARDEIFEGNNTSYYIIKLAERS